MTSDGGFVLSLLFFLSLTGFIGLCCKKKKQVERESKYVEESGSITTTPESFKVSPRHDEDESPKSKKEPKKCKTKQKTKRPKAKPPPPPLPDGIEFRAPKDPAYRTLAFVKSDNIYGPTDEELAEQKKLDLEPPTYVSYVSLSLFVCMDWTLTGLGLLRGSFAARM